MDGAEPATPANAGTASPSAEDVEKDVQKDDEASVDLIQSYLNQTFGNHTETQSQAVSEQRRVVASRVEHVLANFVDIGGYFRAGYGRTGKGGPLTGFQAPGAMTKYRLGNEAENYGELIIGKNFFLPDTFQVGAEEPAPGLPKGPIARVQLRISFYNPYTEDSTASSTSLGLPEAWASIGNVIPGLPEAKFWAGNRFYRRHDVHISDFFFWNISGGGGGIEDVDLGFGKLAFAWVGLGSTSGLSYLPQPEPENQAGFSKANYDLRLYDVPFLGGAAELGLIYAHSTSGLDQDGYQDEPSHGAALHFVHTVSKFLSEDGVNKFALQLGTGPAKTFTSSFGTEVIDGQRYIVRDDPSSWRVRLIESFSASPHRLFSLSPVVVFQATSPGTGQWLQYWVSGGVRPVVHFSRYVNLAVEGGIDWVQDENTNVSGSVRKLTFAPQVTVARQFMSRPVVRGFVTLADWDDALIGQVGGLDFASQSDGVNWGMQMEAWW